MLSLTYTQYATPKSARPGSQETQNQKAWCAVHPCYRDMLVKNAYLEINTSFQLERDGKQYNVMANQNTISSYLNEDIFQYKDNVDELTEKLLLLEKVDFPLSSNGQMITKMVDYQEKPDQQTNED